MSATTVIARFGTAGEYGKPWEIRLVALDGDHYVVNEEWTGVRQLRGEQYRPVVYKVPADLVATVAGQIERWAAYDGAFVAGEWTSDRWACPTTHGDAFARETLPKLTSLGEMGDHLWMRAL